MAATRSIPFRRLGGLPLPSQRFRFTTKDRILTVLTVALVSVLGLSSCAALSQREPGHAEEIALEHIHGLALDLDDEGILVASHGGIYRLESMTASAELTGPLGGLDFDAMGFVRAGDTLYASGHPGPTTPDTFGDPHLGLIRSTDGAETWENVALAGESDFHALSVSSADFDRLFGLDFNTLRRSDDGGRTWTDLGPLAARDLAAPGEADTLYATTTEGLAVSRDAGATFDIDEDAPPLAMVASLDEQLVGITVDERLAYRTPSGNWRLGGSTDQPQAMTAAPDGRVVVADRRGIVVTEDYGSTWTVLRAYRPHL